MDMSRWLSDKVVEAIVVGQALPPQSADEILRRTVSGFRRSNPGDAIDRAPHDPAHRTPGRPEIDQHRPVPRCREVEGSTVQRDPREGRRRAAGQRSGLPPLDPGNDQGKVEQPAAPAVAVAVAVAGGRWEGVSGGLPGCSGDPEGKERVRSRDSPPSPTKGSDDQSAIVRLHVPPSRAPGRRDSGHGFRGLLR
jgi:hypothetical protein